MRTPIFAALAAVAVLAAGSVSAEVLHFTAKLDGASETPPKVTKGAGSADVTLDTNSKMLMWKVKYSGLSGPAPVRSPRRTRRAASVPARCGAGT